MLVVFASDGPLLMFDSLVEFYIVPLAHEGTLMNESITYRRPTRLADVHRGLVGEGFGSIDIFTFEEGVRPSSGLVD